MRHWRPNRPGVDPGARIICEELSLAADVVVGPGSVLVGDRIEIAEGTVIGPGCDLRASELLIGPRSEFGSDVRVLVAERFSVGAAARVARGASLTCRSFRAGNLLYFGDEASVGYGGTTASSAHVSIGSRVTIGQHSILNANLPITIGDNVGTGSYLSIWTHGYHFGHGPLDGFETAYAPVTIEDNVWLGFHITLLPGVSVGRNSIVAAGAVVARSLPENVLAAGVPAKVKKAIPAQRLAPDAAVDAVAAVVDRWAEELRWKGHRASREPGGGAWTSALNTSGGAVSERMTVTVQSRDQPVAATDDGAHRAVVFVDGLPDGFERDRTDISFFDVRNGTMGGPRTRLSEDLRNELRRHAMPCGETHTFTSIEPEPFGRLSRVDDAGEGLGAAGDGVAAGTARH
ncbi:DapH/DapD/GlmU-related protein [Streptomyces heilongjiangensis]|uniref:DapH/DapD/GlmU-related protein n=1 Tax=Streptomyces heilongjiangensis TaxID=945052 RepID=A0ABW1BEZ8_9ACTN|nr:DapH/DapD/GlmU-related protein [Streptomyces heilongjiangensis]MDC2950197.1 DapH/DapD/GlmU-related protein [Streptomyces heilongjiangensis]